MVLISAGNEHEFFPFSFLNIFLLRSVLQVDFKLMKVRLQLCFIGLGLEAIEIPLPLLLRETCFFLPVLSSSRAPLCAQLSPVTPSSTHRALPLKVMSSVSIKSGQPSLQQLVWYVGEDVEAVVWLKPRVAYPSPVNSSRPRY